MNDNATGRQVTSEARLEYVPLNRMRVNPLAQREVNRSWVNRIAADFAPEMIGNPVVNRRDGWHWIIDGQHRTEALKLWLGASWEAQSIECRVYDGLTEEQEAEMFLRLQARIKPGALDEFRVAVSAGREAETDISRIAESLGLTIARSKRGISAAATLKRVYGRGGAEGLERTLRIIRDAYGDAGFDAAVIDGIGLFCRRYATQVKDERVIQKLSSAHGGVGALINRANQLRQTTGHHKAQCMAAAVVDTVNRGAGGGKIPTWWKSAPEE